MPYRSEAQRALFHALMARGEMSPTTVHEWDRATKGKKLPKRLARREEKQKHQRKERDDE